MGISFYPIIMQVLPGAVLGIIALVLAIRHWKRNPTPSMLVLLWAMLSLLSAVGALTVLIFLVSGLVSSGGFNEIYMIVFLVAGTFMSFAPALLLFAVYAGRRGEPEQVSRQH